MTKVERVLIILLLFAGIAAVVDSCRMVTTTLTAQGPVRTSAWAEAVKACEEHGGIAVPRATAVLGRSADLPACVPQLGD